MGWLLYSSPVYRVTWTLPISWQQSDCALSYFVAWATESGTYIIDRNVAASFHEKLTFQPVSFETIHTNLELPEKTLTFSEKSSQGLFSSKLTIVTSLWLSPLDNLLKSTLTTIVSVSVIFEGTVREKDIFTGKLWEVLVELLLWPS